MWIETPPLFKCFFLKKGSYHENKTRGSRKTNLKSIFGELTRSRLSYFISILLFFSFFRLSFHSFSFLFLFSFSRFFLLFSLSCFVFFFISFYFSFFAVLWHTAYSHFLCCGIKHTQAEDAKLNQRVNISV